MNASLTRIALTTVLLMVGISADSRADLRLSQGSDRWLPRADAHWVTNADVRPDQALTRLLSHPDPGLPPSVTPAQVWMLFHLTHPQDESVSIYLTNENALLAELDAFVLDHTGQVRQQVSLGQDQPDLASRPVATRQQDVIRVDGDYSRYLLFRMSSDTPLALAVKATDASLITEENRQRYAHHWAMFVTVLAIFLFNAVLSLGYGDRAYRWFLAFHGLTILYFSGLTGFGHIYLPVSVIHFLTEHITALNFLLLLLLYEFSLGFLCQQSNLNEIRKPFFRWGLPAMHVTGFLVSFILADHYLLFPFVAVQSATIVPVLATAWRQARSGYAPAYFLFTSILVQTIGGSLGLATYAGWIPANGLTLYAFFISTVIELLIMSSALSARIRFLETRQWRLLLQEPTTQLPNEAYINQLLEPWWARTSNNSDIGGAALIQMQGFEDITHIMGPRTSLKVWTRVIEQWNQFLSSHTWSRPLPKWGTQDRLVVINRDTLLALIKVPEDHDWDQTFEPMRSIEVDCEGQLFEVQSLIAVHGDARNTPMDEVMRELSVAMVTARRHHRFIQPYDPQQDAYFRRQNRLSRDLRTAVVHRQLIPHVQPILDLHTNRIIGGELLMRWTHPELGPISPCEFIPLAEDMRWLPEMTRFALNEAALWLKQPATHDLSLSLNLSVLDLITDDSSDSLVNRIQALALPAHRLKVEVTETVLMEQPESCQQTLDQLRRLGCRISIDDFGTGYSSLAYLSRIRPDEIKIDRSFIQALQSSSIDRDIVAAIVRLGHQMRAHIVAEGVEDLANLRACQSLDCDRIQGYLIARPMPLTEFRAWLSSYVPRTEKEGF